MDKKELKTEVCVSCGLNTHIEKNLDVTLRLHYVDGAGQLCKDCYDNVFKGRENDVSDKF
jgi:hypothetical protein